MHAQPLVVSITTLYFMNVQAQSILVMKWTVPWGWNLIDNNCNGNAWQSY